MKQTPFFDDLSKMASGAAGAMMDMRREVEQMVGAQLKQVTAKMDLVSREEFEVVKAMAKKARLENEALKERLEKLEKPSKAATKKPAKK